MRSIPAREIKRRGISAVDAELAKGPVYIIKNDEPKYVVLSREQYEDLLEDYEESLEDQVRASLADIEAGRVRRVTADQLAEEFGLRE
jgi:PHD/YefM family antitoxin component YafN of YafNO toxin-antitoxin module